MVIRGRREQSRLRASVSSTQRRWLAGEERPNRVQKDLGLLDEWEVTGTGNGDALGTGYGLHDRIAADARPGLVLPIEDQRRHPDRSQRLEEIEVGEVIDHEAELPTSLHVVATDMESECLCQGRVAELTAEGVPKHGFDRSGFARGERLRSA